VRVELHPDARAELRSAALWYDQRRIGLGDEFIAEIAAVLDRIGEAAESFPKWPGTRAADPASHAPSFSIRHRFREP
jgi:hypothetical protein